jgi:hypothetical protein
MAILCTFGFFYLASFIGSYWERMRTPLITNGKLTAVLEGLGVWDTAFCGVPYYLPNPLPLLWLA